MLNTKQLKVILIILLFRLLFNTLLLFRHSFAGGTFSVGSYIVTSYIDVSEVI